MKSPPHSCVAFCKRLIQLPNLSGTGHGSTLKPALRNVPIARGMCEADVTRIQRREIPLPSSPAVLRPFS